MRSSGITKLSICKHTKSKLYITHQLINMMRNNYYVQKIIIDI